MALRTPSTRLLVAPVVPTAEAHTVHRPVGLDQVVLTGGLLADRQALNADASLPSNIGNLENDGALDNLRVAAGATGYEYRKPLFMDAAVHKTLDAVAWELARRPDPELEAWMSGVIDILEAVQAEDGYINSFVQVLDPAGRYRHLGQSHEIYCGAILMSAAVSATRAGLADAPRLMAVATRFADHVVDTFLDKRPEIDGHPGAEFSFVEFYRHTGDRRYLDMASQFVLGHGEGRVDPGGRRRYYLDHESVLTTDTEVGHAVRAMYLDTAVVDLYLETGDRTLLDQSLVRWEDLVATKTYLTGGLGSRHSEEAFGDRWELPPDRAYAETCASWAAILWNWRLLLATGEARFAEFIERSLYNVMLASTAMDGTHFFYVNPLQRRTDHFESDDPGRRHAWFYCPCCPPNITRLFSSLGHYLVTTTADTVYLHQFATASVTVDLDGELALATQTEYPWEGSFTVRVEAAPAGERTIALRRPSWATVVTVRVDDEAVAGEPGPDGYIHVTRAWRPGQVLRLDVEMTARMLVADDRIDAVRGQVAFERGPLVYCFEDMDQAEGVAVADLRVPATARPRVRQEASYSSLGRTVLLEIDAEVVDRGTPAGLPYRDIESPDEPTTRPVTAVAVPYFAWDNRDGRGMRVWLPLTPRT